MPLFFCYTVTVNNKEQTILTKFQKPYSLVFIGLGVFIGAFIALGADKLVASESVAPQVVLELPPIQVETIDDIDYEGLRCLAENIYFEAGNQHTAGMVAVANVTLNRVTSTDFPDTICGVVHQGEYKPSWKDPNVNVPVLNRCQFSWWCDGKSDTVYEGVTWDKSQTVALSVYLAYLDGKMLDITDEALYYHANYVSPRWAKHMERTSKIGDHIFYK